LPLKFGNNKKLATQCVQQDERLLLVIGLYEFIQEYHITPPCMIMPLSPHLQAPALRRCDDEQGTREGAWGLGLGIWFWRLGFKVWGLGFGV